MLRNRLSQATYIDAAHCYNSCPYIGSKDESSVIVDAFDSLDKDKTKHRSFHVSDSSILRTCFSHSFQKFLTQVRIEQDLLLRKVSVQQYGIFYPIIKVVPQHCTAYRLWPLSYTILERVQHKKNGTFYQKLLELYWSRRLVHPEVILDEQGYGSLSIFWRANTKLTKRRFGWEATRLRS